MTKQPKQAQFQISISPGSHGRLQAIAAADGKGSASLAAVWLQVKIDDEFRWRVDHDLLPTKALSSVDAEESSVNAEESDELLSSVEVIRRLIGERAKIPAPELAIAAQVLGIDVDKLIEASRLLGGTVNGV